ncbi:MAG: sugar transporter [Bacteroidetes bacterium]|nr:sugar transporter [Bacteroidota bacterium]
MVFNKPKPKIIYQVLKALLLTVCVFSSSCVRHPQLLDFRNTSEFVPLQNQEITNQIRIRIQPDDALYIRIKTLDIEAEEPFNLIPTTSLSQIGSQNGNPTIQGYLVDIDGNIDLPVIGRLKIAGMTVNEAKAAIAEKLTPYLKDPVVIIRFMNFRFTVIGEVKAPRTITVPGERMTILEALGQAGDLTPYSNRENILVIREHDGKREFGYVNIHSPQVFESPYFYLQQNDIIYVEPIKEATATVRDPIFEALPIISSVISITAFIIAFTR